MFKKENSVGINVIGGNGNNKISGNKIIGYDEAIRLDNTNSNNEISDNYIINTIDSEISKVIDSLSIIGDGALNPNTNTSYKDEIISILNDIKTNGKKNLGEKVNNVLGLFNNWIAAQPRIESLVSGVIDVIRGLTL